MSDASTTLPEAIAEISAETPCSHCGLPVGEWPVKGEQAVFCCTGCEIVYDALQNAGLQDTYYRLRAESGNVNEAVRKVEKQEMGLAGLDDPQFIESHTQLLADGSREATLSLEGLHCTACVWLIEQMPQLVPGVMLARVDFVRNQLKLRWFPEQHKLSDAAIWLAQFGYKLVPLKHSSQKERSEHERKLLTRVGISWSLAGNVMLLSFAFYSGMDLTSQADLTIPARWLSMILASISLYVGGQVFFKKAWSSLKVAYQMRSMQHLHMDLPISLGIMIGYSYSLWATITSKGDVWFDSITVLIAALLTARWVHVRSTRIAQDASDQLLELVPTMARRLMGTWSGDPNQPFEIVSVDAVSKNELIIVYAGEVFPADGLVVYGESTVNNAVITGESKPVSVEIGDAVQAGATNLSMNLVVTVQAVGEETRIGKLVAWVREGGEKSAQIVQLVDKISGWFVLIALGLSIVTAIIWMPKGLEQVVTHVTALLVITCPCALGMATPLALAMAAGKGARAGVYLKQTAVLDLIRLADTLVLDKTGTLTEGNMRIVEWTGDEEALRLAAMLETQSVHPIALAFLNAYPETERRLRSGQVKLTNFKAASTGIEGLLNGKLVRVGQPAWILGQLETPDARLVEQVKQYAQSGYTPLAIAVEEQLAAVLIVGDKTRANAGNMVQKWMTEGKSVWILSGDEKEVVRRLALDLGIPADRARGEYTPEMKQQFVLDAKANGRNVIMMGDGVNDAAALHAADVGIAVQGSSTASMVSADIFVTKPGLTPIRFLFEASQKVHRVILRNLTFSLLYNIIGAVLAIMGFVTPLVGAVAMPLSSLTVIFSSILQKTFVDEKEASTSK